MADQTDSTNVTSDQIENGQGSVTGDTQVVTQQPKPEPKKDDGDDDDKISSFEKEGPSARIEIDPFNEEGCVSVTAGVGSVSKDYMDGTVNAEYVGPNVGCVMSIAECPNIVTDCTFELCSANYQIGIILCTFGLAFDTKLKWTPAGVEAEMCGTGVDTSEGFALAALGMKIGLANEEKRKKKWAKKRMRWQKKVGPEPDTENGEVGAGADGL